MVGMPTLYIIAVAITLLAFLIFFNRDPEREIPEGDVVVAPADGKVIEISKGKDWDKIIIFMNIHNVHVQRVPYSGKVLEIEKTEGKNLPAFQTDAGHNKQIITTFETKIGKILVKQATGFFVRRIKNYLSEGQKVKTGERLGRILLGSRVELWLPAGSCNLKIKKGEKVRAGETIIGEINAS